jgi:hypothetical protein
MMKSRRMRWAGHVTQMEVKRKPEQQRPLGRCRRRWKNNIKMDLREIGWGYMDWVDVA